MGKEMTEAMREVFRMFGKQGARARKKKGYTREDMSEWGKMASKNLTPEQRRERARKGGLAKSKKKGNPAHAKKATSHRRS